MEVFYWLSFLLLSLFFSCSNLPQKLSPEVFYNYDLQINNVKGAGTIPFAERYTFDITAPADMDLLSITTCHREFYDQPKAKTYSYAYTPLVEKNRFCPVYFSAYNREGRTSFGMVLPEDPKRTQKATLQCNGKINSPVGTAVCESKAGLITILTFPAGMKTLPPVTGPSTRTEPCPPMAEGIRQVYEFHHPARECIYRFENASNGARFVLYSIGHEQIIVR